MKKIMRARLWTWMFVLGLGYLSLLANALASIGPVGEHSLAVAVDPRNPKTLYLNVYQIGVFKSTDAGESWFDTGFHETTNHALAVDPSDSNTVYVGSGVTPETDFGFIGGFYKSTDAGQTWSGELTGRTNLTVSGIAVDPKKPGTIYLATDQGLLRSPNGGKDWELPLLTQYVFLVVIDPKDAQTIYTVSGVGYLKSEDGGATWTNINPSYAVLGGLTLDPWNSQTLYAAVSDGVYKSRDGGRTWAPSGLSQQWVVRIVVDPQHPQILYATTYNNGVYKSTNAGQTWSESSRGLDNPARSGLAFGGVAVDPSDPNILYVCTCGGLYKSHDGGRHWSAKPTGGAYLNIWSIVVDFDNPETLYTTSTSYGGTVHKSTDRGKSWSLIQRGLSASFLFVLARDPKTPSTLYVGGSHGVFKTTNGGDYWFAANRGLPLSPPGVYVRSIAIDPQNPSTLYCGFGQGAGVYKSTDAGRTWSLLPIAGLTNETAHGLVVDPEHSNTLFVGFNGAMASIRKSTDGGATWRRVLVDQPVIRLAFDPQNPDTMYAGTGFPSLVKIYKSTDRGETWSPLSLERANESVHGVVIDPQHPNTVYAGIVPSGVFKSTDGGATWSEMNAGLPNRFIRSMAIDPKDSNTIYAGTNGDSIFVSYDGGKSWK